MRGRLWQAVGLTGALALSILAGCQRREAAERSTTGMNRQPAATDTGARVAPTGTDTTRAAAAGTAELTDANIVALLDEVNKADSTAGALAVRKATNPDVKSFATRMMKEHHALRAEGQQLAKKLGVKPEPPANDPVQPAAQSEMQALRSAPKGAEFDRTYMDQEVTIHQAAIDLLDKAHDSTKNEQLKALIQKAKPVIQAHLDRAEEIQKKIGKTTA
jgi:putative membrane protein